MSLGLWIFLGIPLLVLGLLLLLMWYGKRIDKLEIDGHKRSDRVYFGMGSAYGNYACVKCWNVWPCNIIIEGEEA